MYHCVFCCGINVVAMGPYNPMVSSYNNWMYHCVFCCGINVVAMGPYNPRVF